MICEYSLDDGAYVLGALAPAERAAFERHLTTCASCRDAVATLAVLPGLLGRLDAGTAIPTITAPPSLLGRTLTAATARRRTQRRRRQWTGLATVLAAAVLATVVGVGVHLADSAISAVPLSQMTPVRDHVPITAEIGLTSALGGTKIDMICDYAEGSEGMWLIRLVVYPRSGGAGEQVSTWTAASGQRLTVNAMSHYAQQDIGRVELQDANTRPILTWTRT
jgi:hypothetical protein